MSRGEVGRRVDVELAVGPVDRDRVCRGAQQPAGALVSGALSDRFGRKPILIAAAANFLLENDLCTAYIRRLNGDMGRHF